MRQRSEATELDWAVGEEIMGLKYRKDPDDETPGAILRTMAPEYSSDIGQAMQVVHRMTQILKPRSLMHVPEVRINNNKDGWRVGFNGRQGVAEAEELPEAICLAALEAIRRERSNEDSTVNS